MSLNDNDQEPRIGSLPYPLHVIFVHLALDVIIELAERAKKTPGLEALQENFLATSLRVIESIKAILEDTRSTHDIASINTRGELYRRTHKMFNQNETLTNGIPTLPILSTYQAELLWEKYIIGIMLQKIIHIRMPNAWYVAIYEMAVAIQENIDLLCKEDEEDEENGGNGVRYRTGHFPYL